jgi:hypothetical protein
MQGRFKMEYRLFTIVRYNYDYRDYNTGTGTHHRNRNKRRLTGIHTNNHHLTTDYRLQTADYRLQTTATGTGYTLNY